MGFEYDVFISYASEDNKPLTEGEKGWVSNFQKFLDTMLDQLLGLDVKFATSEDRPQEAGKTAIFIAVCSPNSVNAPNCSRELDAFLKAGLTNGIKSAPVTRVFKVVKTPVPFEKLPAAMHDMISYDFFQVDPETAKAYEFTEFFNADAEKNYWMKLVDLAYDTFKGLSEMRVSHSYVSPSYKKDSVYLAETTHDLLTERDIIKRELQRHGYRVLPDHTLPAELGALESAVREYMKECKLSIHLIGSSYGEYVEGAEKSLIDIENKIAADQYRATSEHNKASREVKEFSRLIWLPVNLKVTSEMHKAFIEQLRKDSVGAEVLQISLEDLKAVIRNMLALRVGEYAGGDQSFRASELNSKAGLAKIYMICDQSDLKSSEALSSYLKQKGFEVMTSSFEGDLMTLRHIHQENLVNCDASIIYCANASPEWLNAKMHDLMKAPGLGRTKPMIAKAIFTESEETLGRVAFKLNDAIIMSSLTGFSADKIQPFITKIESAG
ncbi:MAG: hypothetical protein ACJ75J_05185 [Cytophagaceae bacterium]